MSGDATPRQQAWDALNRRLVGALLALDLDDVLTLREPAGPDERPRGLLGRRKGPLPPRRFVSATAGQSVLVLETIGSTSFGGAWAMTAEQEQRLERLGWERPWNDELTTWLRDVPVLDAPRAALALVRALQVLDVDPTSLEQSLDHVPHG